MANHTIHVQIFGHQLPLIVNKEDEMFIRDIAAFVDARMQAARQDMPNHNEITCLIMATMMISEELFTMRKNADQAYQNIELKIGTMLDKVNATLKPIESSEK